MTFLVGAARSGTSLLYKLLCLHPDAAWISNWVARFPGVPLLAALNRIARRMPARAPRVWFGGGSNAYVYGSPRSWPDRAFPMPVEGEPVYRTAGVIPTSPGVIDDAAVERLRRAFHRVASLGGGSVLVSKRIANNLRIPFLIRTFPSARFVEMVRDGRAVACSLSRVDWWSSSVVSWYGGTPIQWEEAGGDPWELCARNWVEELEAVRDGLEAVPEDRILRVRYETLVADPISTIGSIARFVGLEPDSRWDASLAALSFPDRNERWRRELDPGAVETIIAVQREALRELGYLDDDQPASW